MEFEEVFQKYLPLLRTNILFIAIGFLGLILLSVGILASLNTRDQSQESFDSLENSSPVRLAEKKIEVDVSGAVIKPGVYSLNDGDRVKDALVLASGLSSSANRDWVSKTINLAQKLSDGQKIYIPFIGEESIPTSVISNTVSVGGLININSASSKDLDGLPGIGPATAQKIIDNRPYLSIDDLLSKKVVTNRVFGVIKDKITY